MDVTKLRDRSSREERVLRYNKTLLKQFRRELARGLYKKPRAKSVKIVGTGQTRKIGGRRSQA